MKAIITVVGKDQVGIMYKVSGILNDKHAKMSLRPSCRSISP